MEYAALALAASLWPVEANHDTASNIFMKTQVLYSL